MMLKRLTGKTISFILMALMLISILPLSAAATTAASVDVVEMLDNFTSEELSATYTSTAPYTTTTGITAPWAINGNEYLSVTACADDTVGDYLHVTPNSSSNVTIDGGLAIQNNNLNLGSGSSHNNVMTFSTKIRRPAVSDSLYFALLDSNGNKVGNGNFIRGWTNSIYWYYPSGDTGYDMAANTWYDITVTWDFAQNKAVVEVSGGAYDHVTKTVTPTAIADTVTISGVRIGWNGGASSANSFDIADISISNTGSLDYDEELEFEGGTLVAGATSWSVGNWKVGASSQLSSAWVGKFSVEDTGYPHNNAFKMVSGKGINSLWLVNTLPTAETEQLILEASYRDNVYSTLEMQILSSDSVGTGVLTYPTGASWDVKFMDSKTTDDNGDALSMPRNTDEWIRIRAILDMKNDKATFEYWKESDPANVVTATDTTKIAELTDIKTVRFKAANYGESTSDYHYLDDFRVYAKSALRYEGSLPADTQGAGVSVSANPAVLFNMPIAASSLTAETNPVKLELRDGNNDVVNGTTALSEQRNGIAFYPTGDLKPAEDYTLTAKGTVTDAFGQTLAIDKTIKFTTDDIIKINSTTFTQTAGTVTKLSELAAGDLTATVNITSCDGTKRDVLVLMGLYNVATNELEMADAEYLKSAAHEYVLTVRIPEDENNSYYPVVYVWDTYASLKPYVTPITLK